VIVAQVVARPAHPDEQRQLEQFFPALPRQYGGQRVGAGDEVQLGVRVEGAQIAQACPWCRWGPSRSMSTPAHREPRIGRRSRSPVNQIAVFGGGHLPAPSATAGRWARTPLRRGRNRSGHLAGGKPGGRNGWGRTSHPSLPPCDGAFARIASLPGVRSKVRFLG